MTTLDSPLGITTATLLVLSLAAALLFLVFGVIRILDGIGARR